jgi:hypothetical protein
MNRAYLSNQKKTKSPVNKVSPWVHMTQGQEYYMEGRYLNSGGAGHFSTAVEIEQSAVVGHHHAMKEIQELKVTTAQTKEKAYVQVMNPDDKLYILTFKNPTTNKYVPTEEKIPADASAGAFAGYIAKYYSDTVGSSISVEKIGLDANYQPTNVANDIKGYRYEITTNKLIEGVSTAQILVAKVTTGA